MTSGAALAISRLEYMLVLGLTTLGAGVRIFQLGTQSLWLDEIFSVFAARGDWTHVLTSSVQGDTNPPLFNLLLHLVLQRGSDEVAARALSCLFSIACIPLSYAFTRELFDPPIAGLAALLLALNPFHLLFAQEARMYAQLAFFSLAAAFFFHRAWRPGEPPFGRCSVRRCCRHFTRTASRC